MRNTNGITIASLVLILILVSTIGMDAQCPMCRMAAESNLQNGGTEARGLNNGILYLLSMPYILIGSLVVIWYKNRTKETAEN